MQAKRISVAEGNKGASQNITAQLIVPAEPREEVNFHNIWASASVEPQDANANCQGTWVLYTKKVGEIAVNFIDTTVNAEGSNAKIIACGVFSASNEFPWTSDAIHPETSRTLEAGDSLEIQCVITGITAGLASARVMICAHTVRK